MAKLKPDKEANRIGGRISRYAKVSTAVGGLAVKMAGQKYLGLKANPDKNASELRLALGGLKGPLMKVAQMLATIPDAVPKEYAQELAQLQADAPAMGWPFVKRRMAAELGADWEKKFKSFPREAASAASLGQVHKAVTLKGDVVACKLQYPDMASAVEADLKQLKLILGLFERMDPAFKTRQVHAEISDRLREELDYGREARALQMFAEMLKDEPGVHIPRFYKDLSSNRLLTMQWLEGQKLLTFKGASQKIRNQIALNMFRAWYVPFYHYGVIHGDPHLGNYTVADDYSLNLLDFGCLRIFPAKFVGGVLELYNGLRDDREDQVVEAFRIWGFKNLKKETIDILTIWARFIYGPILDDRKRLIDEEGAGQYGRSTAKKVHFALRDVGGVEVPREFVFMDRAAVGLGSVFLHLKAEVNWHQLFNEMVEGFDLKSLEKRQKNLLPQFGF